MQKWKRNKLDHYRLEQKNTVPLIVLISICLLVVCPPATMAQEETTSEIRRYQLYEMSSGYYEKYELKPRAQAPPVPIRGVFRKEFPYTRSGSKITSKRLAPDSHAGIKNYNRYRCEDCHYESDENLMTIRAGLTCRQCHGGEPIASIDHYYSPLNPIRLHAYVCAKCHSGANASFAQYVVHEPKPYMSATRATFPWLFWVFWIMVAIAVVTFVITLPQTALFGLRELFKKNRHSKESKETGNAND
jgi:hypothetical protein